MTVEVYHSQKLNEHNCRFILVKTVTVRIIKQSSGKVHSFACGFLLLFFLDKLVGLIKFSL